jgi:putative ABC transport system permease protein
MIAATPTTATTATGRHSMSVIWHKVWRDLARHKTRTALVVLSTALGVTALGIVISLSEIMTGQLTSVWPLARPAHLLLALHRTIGDDRLPAVARTPGVSQIEPTIVTTVRWKLPGETEWRPAQLTARRDYAQQQQNIVSLWDGGWPQSNRDIAVERLSAAAFDIPLGREIVIKTDQAERTLQVTGVPRDLIAVPPQFGGSASFFVTRDAVENLIGSRDYNELLISLPQFDPDAARTVADRVKTRLANIDISSGTPFIQDPSRHYLQDVLDPILVLMGVLGVVALILSAFLVINTINAILAQQVTQIGMMKAVGATTFRVMRLYLAMVLVYGWLALVIAIPVAAIVAFALAGLLLPLANLEVPAFQLIPRAVEAQVAVGLLVPIVATSWPVLAGARTTVHQAIAAYGLSSDFGHSSLDRIVGHLGGLPRPMLLSLRNTFRQKRRVGLTQITLIVAGVMFIAVMSAGSSFTRTLDQVLAAYGADVLLIFDQAQRFERAAAVARTVPGVTGGEVWVVRSGTLDLGSHHQRDAVFWAVPPDSTLFHPTITAGRWLLPEDESALVVNQRIAQEEGLQVGDRINVKLESGTAAWTIVGLLVDLNNQQRTIFAPRDAFARALHQPDRGSLFWVKTDQHAAADQAIMERQLRAALEANGMRVADSRTMEVNRHLNLSQFSIVSTLLLAMSVLTGIVGAIGLAGTLSINVLERSTEIGVLRAIGASSRAIRSIFVSEGVLLGVLSALVAIPLSYPCAQWLCAALSSALVPLEFQYSIEGMCIWLALIVIMSALASLWPAMRAAHLTVRDSLAYE